MSFPHTVAIWKLRGMDPAEKLLLLALADHADPSGFCWPSLSTLADETGLCRTSVCKKLSSLERRGLIARDKGGFLRSTRYTIRAAPDEKTLAWFRGRDITGGEENAVRGSDPDTLRVVCPAHQGGASHARGVVRRAHGGSASDAPESTNESVIVNPPKRRSAGEPDAEGSEDSQRLANGVTLDPTVPEEVRRLWPEWLAYRTERHTARGREKLAWTLQTARMSAESIARACARLPGRVVADRIRAAIEGRWQGLNLDRLEAPKPPGGGQRTGPAGVRSGNGIYVVRGGGL